MPTSERAPRQLWLIARYQMRHALRGGVGLVFVLVTLTFGLGVAHVIITPVELQRAELGGSRGDETDELVIDALVEAARPAVTWAIGAGADASADERSDARSWASYLLDERPALVSGVFLILLYALPFLVVLGAFNQVAGDVGTRGLRYQLIRASRAQLYLGRALASTLIIYAALFAVVAVIALYVGIQVGVYEWSALLAWSAMGFAALAIAATPYVALCSAISASVSSAFGALALSVTAVGGVPLFALIGSHSWEPLAGARYLLPWGIQSLLLHPGPWHVAASALGCLAYAAALWAVGYAYFARRDL